MEENFKIFDEKDYLWRNFQVLNENNKLQKEIVARYKLPEIP